MKKKIYEITIKNEKGDILTQGKSDCIFMAFNDIDKQCGNKYSCNKTIATMCDSGAAYSTFKGLCELQEELKTKYPQLQLLKVIEKYNMPEVTNKSKAEELTKTIEKATESFLDVLSKELDIGKEPKKETAGIRVLDDIK